jgi:hypothetical protein
MFAASVIVQHSAPKRNGALVVLEFADDPTPGKTLEYQISRVAPHAQAALAGDYEKFGETKIGLVSLTDRRTTYDGETYRALVFKNHHRIGAVVREPTRQKVGLAIAEFALHRKNAGVHADLLQIRQILAKNALDPIATFRRVTSIANADWHEYFQRPCGCLFGVE